LKNFVPEIRADGCSDDEVMIPEMEERAEIENSDNDVEWFNPEVMQKFQPRLPH
jgi:hypothetical protein